MTYYLNTKQNKKRTKTKKKCGQYKINCNNKKTMHDIQKINIYLYIFTENGKSNKS